MNIRRRRGGQPPGKREAHLFARVQTVGVVLGVVATLVGFALYLSGVVPPLHPVEVLMTHWGLRSGALALRLGWPQGWGWLSLLPHSDMLTLGGLILLSCAVVVAYLVLLIAVRSTAYRLLVVLQLLVFGLAASGLGGAH